MGMIPFIQQINTHSCIYLFAGDGRNPRSQTRCPKGSSEVPKRLPMKEKIPGPSQDAQLPKCMDHSAHPLPAPLFYSLEAFPQCTCAVWAPGHVAGFFPYVTEFPALVPLYSVIYYLNFASSIPFMLLTNIFI